MPKSDETVAEKVVGWLAVTVVGLTPLTVVAADANEAGTNPRNKAVARMKRR